MKTPNIAFIGAGNMASSIIGGLLEGGHPAAGITAADPYQPSLENLQARWDIHVHPDNAAAAADADVVILAVKPQVMAEAAVSVADAVASNAALVISIAAGITVDSLERRLGEHAAIVRCMPNTPALLGAGASGLFANEQATDLQRSHAQDILSAVGITCWVDEEEQLDAITALSGSGPAYFFLFFEAMIDAGCELGLDRETATQLALQTGLGAARMSLENALDVVELRRQVTSPAGTTEKAIESFERDGLRTLVSNAMQAASKRAKEMARDMG